MNDTGKIIRPKIDSDYVVRIKSKYPNETALLNNQEAITWALDRFLAFEEIVKDGPIA